MLLANDGTGAPRGPRRTGERGGCPGCEATVISKVGLIVRPHWAHYGVSDCDTWAGRETDWHLNWKQQAMKAGFQVEVSMRDGDTLHRADAVSPRRHILEFQHSGLRADELRERSYFYGDRGVLCWVFDGSVSVWRRVWWDWVKGRAEPPDGLEYAVLDEVNRPLRAKRIVPL